MLYRGLRSLEDDEILLAGLPDWIRVGEGSAVRVCVPLIIVCLLATSCSDEGKRASSAGTQGNSEEQVSQAEALRILDTCPFWFDIPRDSTVDERRIIVTHLKPLSELEVDDYIRVIKRFAKELKIQKDVDSEFKGGTVLIANRLYFDVPDNTPVAERAPNYFYYGGPKGQYGLALWPLGRDEDGLYVVGDMYGAGPLPYFLEEELAFFESLYGKRLD